MIKRSARIQGSIALVIAAICLAAAAWYSWHPLPHALVELLAPSPTRLQLGSMGSERGGDAVALSIVRGGHYTVLVPTSSRGTGVESSGELEPSERDRLWTDADAVEWSQIATHDSSEPSFYVVAATVEGKEITVGVDPGLTPPPVAPLARDLRALFERYGR